MFENDEKNEENILQTENKMYRIGKFINKIYFNK